MSRNQMKVCNCHVKLSQTYYVVFFDYLAQWSWSLIEEGQAISFLVW
jgi:hypothetical protein